MPLPLLLPLLLAGGAALATTALGERASEESKKRKEEEKLRNQDREVGLRLLNSASPEALGDAHARGGLLKLGITDNEIDAAQGIGVINSAAQNMVIQNFLGDGSQQPAAQPTTAPNPLLMTGTKGVNDTAPVRFGQPTDVAAPPIATSVSSAVPTAPTAPPPPPGLTVPSTKPSASLHLGSMTFTKPATTGKDVTASVISQADQLHLHPNEVYKGINAANTDRLRKGQPPIDLDDNAIKAYGVRHFETVRNQNYQQMIQAGVEPNVAFQQSAVNTFKTLGYVPDQWMQVVKPDPAQLTAGAFRNALSQTNSLIDNGMQVVRDQPNRPLGEIIPLDYLGRQIEQQPGLTPDDMIKVKHEAATKLLASLEGPIAMRFPKLDEFQRQALALKIAGGAVGGVVPQQWMQAALDHPKIFGWSPEMAAAYKAMPERDRPSPFDPEANRKLTNAAVQLENNRDYRKHAMTMTKTPEEAAMVQQQQQGGGATPTPAQVGETGRAIELKQKGAEKTQAVTIEREHAVVPTAEIEKIKPIDDLYTTGVAVQQLVGTKDKDGKTMLDKYGDMPAIAFSSIQAFKKQFGTVPDDVAKYISLLGKVWNVEKKTFAGTATSLSERGDLKTFMPDPTENLRTAVQKLNTLVSTTGGELQRDLKYVQDNYPGTKLESFNYNRIQAKRAADKKAKEPK